MHRARALSAEMNNNRADVKNVHKKVLNFVSSRRFGNNPFISPTDEGVIPETSRTNKTEHFFMNIFHI